MRRAGRRRTWCRGKYFHKIFCLVQGRGFHRCWGWGFTGVGAEVSQVQGFGFHRCRVQSLTKSFGPVLTTFPLPYLQVPPFVPTV